MVKPRFVDYPHKVVNELGKTVRIPEFAYYFGGRPGGKVAGLKDFSDALLSSEARLKKEFGGLVHFACPKTSVLETNLFESYMEKNGLWGVIESQPSEEEMIKRFLEAEFTPTQRATLRFILNDLEAGHVRPAVARSSSLNEDAERASFAGIYSSVLLPNCHPDPEVRLRQFETAIKLVFASVFSDSARVYRESMGIPGGSERMAVPLQNMVGRLWQLKDGNYIYHPEISFAAFSYNDYPVYGANPKDGFVRLAFGLGTGVVDTESQSAVRIQLGKPLTINEMYDVKQAAQNAPRFFYALPFTETDQMPTGENFYIEKFPIDKHANEEMVGRHRMYYQDESFRMYPQREGYALPVLTFANLIKGNFGNRIVQVIGVLNQILQEHYGSYVDFEGAADFIMGKDGKWHTLVYVLQARTQIRLDMARVRELPIVNPEEVVLRAEGAIGRGKQVFSHLLLVSRELFSHNTSYGLAQRVKELNQQLSALGEAGRYLLLAPGRIGSRDPSLGLPCDFSYLDRSVGTFELIEGSWEPSQGTHMFEAMVGSGMILGHYGGSQLRMDNLRRLARLVSNEGGVAHYEFFEPARLDIDEKGDCVIYRKPPG